MILPPSDSDLPQPALWQAAVAGVTQGALIVAIGVTLAVSIGGLR